MTPEMRNFNKRVLGDGSGRQQTVLVDDQEKVLSILPNCEPIIFKDNALQPISSLKKKKLMDNVNYFEAQLGRLAKMAREMRAEIASMTTE